MSKSDESKAREERLAAKLRENLRRRKQQVKARTAAPATAAGAGPRTVSGRGRDG